MTRHNCCTALLLSVCAITYQNLAIAQSGPGEFFEKDYVNSGPESFHESNDEKGRESGGGRASALSNTLIPHSTGSQNSSSPSGFFTFETSSSSVSSVEDGRSSIAADIERERNAANFASGNGIPVESISLIVNGLDKKHFFSCLKDLYELCERTGMRIDTVYVVGNLDSVIDPALKAMSWPRGVQDQPLIGINLYGGKLAVVEEPPKEYPVRLSPSWVVNTKEGAYILEAIGGYKKYFNNRGQLVLVGSPVS